LTDSRRRRARGNTRLPAAVESFPRDLTVPKRARRIGGLPEDGVPVL
jgi:hypothetical protein